ncbi:hypothetical protein HWI77_07215 [Acinetobacter venetianus]|nr:hypothetical protein HWI77_07215 [Acinetobacter venetianus]
MKYIILLVTSLLLTEYAFARETNSIRSSYELVVVGDSESDLLRKMGRSSPRYFIHREGRRSCAATEYIYDIDMQTYTV